LPRPVGYYGLAWFFLFTIARCKILCLQRVLAVVQRFQVCASDPASPALAAGGGSGVSPEDSPVVNVFLFTRLLLMDFLLPYMPSLLWDFWDLFKGELLVQRKYWLRALPRGKGATLLFGEATAPAYASIILIVTVVALFYLKIIMFARSCRCAQFTRALQYTQCTWGIASSLVGLLLYVYELYSLGGGTRLLTGLAGGAGKLKPFRMPLTWALTFNSLAVDSAFTVIASAPFFLRCLVSLVPSLLPYAYPPWPPLRPAAAASGEAADKAKVEQKGAVPPAELRAPGTGAEVLRDLECCEFVLERLLELSILFCMHKYQS
jgi:hypothetical protein